MGIINNDCNGKAEKVTLRILQEWLERKGVLVTWPTLVQTPRHRTLDSGTDQTETSLSHQPHPPQ